MTDPTIDPCRAINNRVNELLSPELKATTAMHRAGPSAHWGCVLVTWVGTNKAERALRVDPRGADLDQVLTEFLDQCRAASGV